MKQSISTQMTKMAIANSLKKLMMKKPIGKITVREIIQDCDINRQTFYYHFRGIFDLVEWMFKQEAVTLLMNSDSDLTWDEGILALLRYIKENGDICNCALASLKPEQLHHFFAQDIQRIMNNIVRELQGDLNVSEKYIAFISEFYTHALVGCLVQWMHEGMNKTPEEFVELIRITMHGNIRDAFKRAAKAD